VQGALRDSAQRGIVGVELWRGQSHAWHLVGGCQLHERRQDKDPVVFTAKMQRETVLWQVDQLFAARWTVKREMRHSMTLLRDDTQDAYRAEVPETGRPLVNSDRSMLIS
jgi:hypothetical protein